MTRQVVASAMPSKTNAQAARLAFVAIQYREEFGAVLKARRVELHLTQSQVADRVETYLLERGKREPGKPFDAQNVSRWERGKNLGTIDNQEAVAHALETTMADLVARIRKPQAAKSTLNGNGPAHPSNADLDRKLDHVLAQVAALAHMIDQLADNDISEGDEEQHSGS